MDPDGATVEKKLLALRQKAAQTPGPGRSFLFYSGHSDERGLLLFGVIWNTPSYDRLLPTFPPTFTSEFSIRVQQAHLRSAKAVLLLTHFGAGCAEPERPCFSDFDIGT